MNYECRFAIDECLPHILEREKNNSVNLYCQVNGDEDHACLLHKVTPAGIMEV
jgi:hypothetical protein